MSAASTDEISKRYRDKAIREINELGDEIAQAAGHSRVPVVGSGHPQATIFLLKFRPRPSELQEGVAFWGRSGQAILKSLQRLHVDALEVYGTNCLKLDGQEEATAAPWLTRELHIVQPNLVVPMGLEALRFLNALEFPLSVPLVERESLQQWTPTIEALTTPDVDESLDEQAAKKRFWNAFKTLGPWWAELPPY